MQARSVSRNKLRWHPPAFFEELRADGELECLLELIHSFAHFSSSRLQLLSDPRARCEPDMVLPELRKLKDSCRQVGADRAASLCSQIERLNPVIETNELSILLSTLRQEVWPVIHEMHAYAAALQKQMSLPQPPRYSTPKTDAAVAGFTLGHTAYTYPEHRDRQIHVRFVPSAPLAGRQRY